MSRASETGLTEDIFREAEMIRNILKESKEFRLLIKNPVIKPQKKYELISALFRNKVNELFMDFFKLIIDKNRIEYLPEIIEGCIRIYNETKSITEVEVKTAVTPNLDEQAVIRQKIESYLNRKIKMNISSDPEIIAGFIARAGDIMIDGSVKNQLISLKKHFTAGN